jgi:hypothetical protein
MNRNAILLHEIDAFLAEKGRGAYRFGLIAAGNGRLVERLREGRRIWPETEMKVRAYILSQRALASKRGAP